MYGTMPPELISVFENPKVYFQLCYIDSSHYSEEDMKQGLSRDLTRCKWYDCLGHHVYIQLNGLEEVLNLVKVNMQKQSTLEQSLTSNINETIWDMIRVYTIDDDTLEEE